jgi:type I restriction enzyme, S subunit
MIAASNHSTWESLPSGWAYDRMKDVVDLRDEKVFVESEETNYLELEDLEGGSGRILSRRDTLTVESAVTRFAKGDVLFGKLRPYLEKYARPDFDGFCTGEILAFHPRRIDGHYLFYHMGSDWLIQRCNALAYGAKMPRVNWPKQLALFDLPLPPLAEQKRIAAYLDASCAAIDRAVETKRKQLETLDALRKSIIQKAVTQGLNPKVEMKDSGVEYLGQVPAHWRVSKMKRLLSEPLSYGLNESGTDDNPDNPRYIRITDFGRDGALRDETFRSLPPDVAAAAPLQEGDILLARSGATVGKSFLFSNFKGEACYAGYLIKARTATQLLLPKFLYQYTRSLSYEAWKDHVFSQATIQNISAVKYAYLETPVPPLAEQEQILNFLDSEIGKTLDLEKLIQSQITTLTAYRKSLIHECVTGKRRISDADVAKVEAHV